jgi:hypothetical protein
MLTQVVHYVARPRYSSSGLLSSVSRSARTLLGGGLQNRGPLARDIAEDLPFYGRKFHCRTCKYNLESALACMWHDTQTGVVTICFNHALLKCAVLKEQICWLLITPQGCIPTAHVLQHRTCRPVATADRAVSWLLLSRADNC